MFVFILKVLDGDGPGSFFFLDKARLTQRCKMLRQTTLVTGLENARQL
jgi:hypothetical protein